MKATWQRLLVLSVLSVGLVRCFGSGESGGGNTCNAFVQAQVSSACGTCVQDKCSSQISAAAAPCADFVTCVCGKGGTASSCASDLDEASCQPASQALQVCATTSCPTQCAGVDSGMGGSDATVADSSGGMDSSPGQDATMESGADTSTVDSSSGGMDSSVAETSTVDVVVVETGPEAAPEAGPDAGDAGDGGCPTGETSCSGTCTDTTKDSKNCGMCGNPCAAGQVCANSACGCPTGQTLCGTTCVDTTSDNGNCGGCAMPCPTGEVCSASTCGCPAGETLCSNACTATSTDPLNCGTCGKTCGPYLNATPSCGGGQCMYTCLPGFLKCKTAVDCSVDTNSDPNNCNGCGNVCPNTPPVPNESPACNSGVCGYACTPPFATCPNFKGTCDVNLNTFNNNCGSCGNVCPVGMRCSGGTCVTGGG
jgi:hypothetical protein